MPKAGIRKAADANAQKPRRAGPLDHSRSIPNIQVKREIWRMLRDDPAVSPGDGPPALGFDDDAMRRHLNEDVRLTAPPPAQPHFAARVQPMPAQMPRELDVEGGFDCH